MPRKGYKSITVKQNIYDYFYQEYSKNREKLEIKDGIHSFSAYVTSRLSELAGIPKEIVRFIMLNHDGNGVKVRDNEQKLTADISITPNGIYCPLCDAHNCEHIRFALDQDDIKEILKQKKKEGWKNLDD
jgi:hypothetical protein